MVAAEVERVWAASARLPVEPAVAPAPPGAGVYVDVGCDHAGLPLTLLQRGRVGPVVAVDLRAAPCAVARENARRLGLALDVRQGEGLAAVPGPVAVVSACGMGSTTVVRVLDAARLRLGAAVVQPNDGAEPVRDWAAAVGWTVERERACWDAGRYYPALVLRPGPGPAPDAVERAWGLRAQQDVDALARRLEAEIARLTALGKPAALPRSALEQLAQARSADPA